jgi:hypothetical protein
MWSKAFWLDAGERAVKTGAQTLLASVPLSALATGLDWGTVATGGGVALCAAGISILTSIASTLRGDEESASLLKPAAGRHARPE